MSCGETGSLDPVHRRLPLAPFLGQHPLGIPVKGDHRRLGLAVPAVLPQHPAECLDVGIPVQGGTALGIAGHRVEHTVGGTVKEIVMYRKIPRGILVAPALDVGGSAYVVALLSPAKARKAQDVVADLAVFHVAGLVPAVLLQEILDGVNATLHEVMGVADILQGIEAAVRGDLVGNARVVDLVDVAVLHPIAVTAAVDLDGVSVAGDGAPHALRVVGVGAVVVLDGAADPAQFAVGHGQPLQALTAPRDGVVSRILDAEVIHRYVGVTGQHEDAPARECLDLGEDLGGVAPVTAQVQLPVALAIDDGDGKALPARGDLGEPLVVEADHIQIPGHVRRHVKGAALVLAADESPADVGGDELAAVGLSAVEDDGTAIEDGLGEPPDAAGFIVRLPQSRIAKALVPAVEAGLLPLAVGGVGHPGTGLDLPAEEIPPLESDAVPVGKLGIRHAGKGLPRRLGSQAVGGVVALVADVVGSPRGRDGIGGGADGRLPLLAELIQVGQEFLGGCGHGAILLVFGEWVLFPLL